MMLKVMSINNDGFIKLSGKCSHNPDSNTKNTALYLKLLIL